MKTQIWDHLAESDEVLPPLLSWRLLTLHGSMEYTGCSGHSYYRQGWLQSEVPQSCRVNILTERSISRTSTCADSSEDCYRPSAMLAVVFLLVGEI